MRAAGRESATAGIEAVRRYVRRKQMIRRHKAQIAALAAVFMAVAVISVTAAVLHAIGNRRVETVDWVEITSGQNGANNVGTAREIQLADSGPFSHMSRDWAADDLEGFVPYTIPSEYEAAGGSFPDVVQKYTYIVCNNAGVDYDVVLALIETESGYRWDAVGAMGDYGYMQIVRKYHQERMDRLECDDLLDPYQNISVGVDYLAELVGRYEGDYGKALTAYQYGVTGAYRHYFSKGADCSPYASKVLCVAERIRTEARNG